MLQLAGIMQTQVTKHDKLTGKSIIIIIIIKGIIFTTQKKKKKESFSGVFWSNLYEYTSLKIHVSKKQKIDFCLTSTYNWHGIFDYGPHTHLDF